MKSKVKSAKLHRGFYEWLQYLETVEHLLATGKQRRPLFLNVNQDMFPTPEDLTDLGSELGPAQAALAHVMRSSVKYQASIKTFIDMDERYRNELMYVLNNRPLHLPHEWCTLVLTDFGEIAPEIEDTVFIISLTETTPSASGDKSYPELDLESEDPFITISFCMYRNDGFLDETTQSRDQLLSHCPIELHMDKGRIWKDTRVIPALPKDVGYTPAAMKVCDNMMAIIVAWIQSFNLASVMRKRQPGLPAVKGPRIKTPKKRKPWASQFEHFVVELEIDEPDPQQQGRTVFQPKKRMHRVRGFSRHLKSGKVIWVKPHWRGDKELGVIAKDYELTLHREEA